MLKAKIERKSAKIFSFLSYGRQVLEKVAIFTAKGMHVPSRIQA